ncbi:MAG TPA: type II toxin-antitoxin system VapC family toxin [Candidatus Dormibacteraeota bacterium]|jgi:predicted nucleic acid-binding protein
MRGALYLDASALVKLVLEEPESPALSAEASRWDEWLSSELTRAEVPRAVVGALTRHGLTTDEVQEGRQRADALMSRVMTVEVDRRVLVDAARVEPIQTRTLDAIHVATVLQVRDEIGAVATYDQRMVAALRQAGIEVISPE